MTTRTLNLMTHFIIIILCIAPLAYLGILSIRANMLNTSLMTMLTENAWSMISLLSACTLPFAGFLMKSKWDNYKNYEKNATEYYYLGLLFILLSLLLMGNVSLAMFILLLMLFTAYTLKIRIGTTLSLLKKKESLTQLAGELVIILIALFVRFAIWRLSGA